MKNKFWGPPYPPKKADFGRTTAKMGYFSQKGLCYSFDILQGLLSNKNIRIPMREKNFGGPPYPLIKADFGRTKAEMGCFSQKGLCYSFEIFHGLLSNKNIRNPMKKIFGESPLHPQLTLFWPDSADMRAGKFPLASMGGWAECPVCADTEAWTPIGASGNSLSSTFYHTLIGGLENK